MREALKATLGGLKSCKHVAEQTREPSFVPLELVEGQSFGLPHGTSIALNLFDHRDRGPQRERMVLELRALLELLVRLMRSPPMQWNAFYNELWQPVLLQRLRASSRHAIQWSLLERRDLPTFLLCMAADELSDDDFAICLDFKTRPSAQVLTVEQQALLRSVESGVKPQQLVVELGLQLSDCKPTEQLTRNVQRLIKRIDAANRDDPVLFPVKFTITTLRFGMITFVFPCNLAVLKELANISGICVQNKLSDRWDADQARWADSLEDFPPRVLLDPSLRSLDLGCLTLTRQHVWSVCSALRATDHIQEVTFMRHYVSDPVMSEQQQIELWAWIAFGILHRDLRSTLKQLNLSGHIGSDKSMFIVCRILTSAHPGKELLLAIAPHLKRVIRAEEIPLPQGKRVFASLQTHTELFEIPELAASTLSIDSITSDMRFEVLIRLNSGWTCILLPGYGVAWISTTSIIAEYEQDSLIRYEDGVQSNSWIKGLNWPFAYNQDVLLLLRAIGYSVEYLSIPNIAGVGLAAILDYCPNLKHLESTGNSAVCPTLLLKAYTKGQCRIESLKIGALDKGILSEMAILLGQNNKTLKQIKFSIAEKDMALLDKLVDAFEKNTTLELLEVRSFDVDLLPQIEMKLKKLNDQTLQIHTPSAIKWAFLSVIKYHKA